MSPHVIQKMGLSPNALRNDSLATVTVQGTSTDQPCQIATGLSVAPLSNPKRKIQLPTTYIQNEIPSASQEVPTHREVAQMPGFEHLAPNFHYTDKGWSTILLIGRNCIEAQMQRPVSSLRNMSAVGPVLVYSHKILPQMATHDVGPVWVYSH